MIPRYIQVRYGGTDDLPQYARIEALERFVVGDGNRQLNLRIKGGLWPTDPVLVEACRREFNIPADYTDGVVLPMAGDRTVLFRKGVKVAPSINAAAPVAGPAGAGSQPAVSPAGVAPAGQPGTQRPPSRKPQR